MKKTLLAFIGVLALVVMATGVLAQTEPGEYGSTDQAGTTASEPARQTGEPTSAGASPESSGSTTPQGSSPTETGSVDDPSSQESLPATASNLPLVLAAGLAALAGMVAVRLYRLRRAH